MIIEGPFNGLAAVDLLEAFELLVGHGRADFITDVQPSQWAHAIEPLRKAQFAIIRILEEGPGFHMLGDMRQVMSRLELGDKLTLGILDPDLAIVKLKSALRVHQPM